MQTRKNQLMKKKFLIIIAVIILAAGEGFYILGSWQQKIITEKKIEELKKQIEKEEEQINNLKQQTVELEKITPEEEAKKRRNLEIFTARSATNDVPVEGIEIIKTKDRKIYKNLAQGYSIEIPLNLILGCSTESNLIGFYDLKTMCQRDPLCVPIINIMVLEKNTQDVSLDEWYSGNIGDANLPEKLNFNGESVYKVNEVTDKFDNYVYYLKRNKNIYFISLFRFDDIKYKSYIETFKFIQ